MHGEVPIWVRRRPGRLSRPSRTSCQRHRSAGRRQRRGFPDAVDQQARLRGRYRRGMSPAFLPAAFGFRQQDSTSTRPHGLGLGLFNCAWSGTTVAS
jgi:hypothetical protein